jgi:ribonuclease Z
MRRFLAALAVSIAFVLGVAYAYRGPIALRLAERVVARNLTTNLLAAVPDGLHVVLCGAGSPLPDPRRSGPCVAVIAGQELYIVDAGSGASRSLARMRLPPDRIEAVLLTHFHSDHIDGLGELLLQRWANGASDSPTPVHGPPGVERVVAGFNRAYATDASYRVAHHGPDTVPPSGAGGRARPFDTPAPGEGRVVLDSNGLRITAFRVDHAPVEPAVGYRFDYGGRSVVLSGDTRKSANLQSFAEDVDLLVHEALSPELVALIERGAAAAGRTNIEKIAADIVDYHTSPVEAAEIARDARVGNLVYYHIVPPLPLAPLEAVFLEGVDEVFDGPVSVGRDGTWVSLPADSDEIEVKNIR